MRYKLIAVATMVVLACVVLLQNREMVVFRFLLWRAEVSQLILVLGTLIIGFVSGLVTAKIGGRTSR
jgi:uncharacterized integral membrane protein